MVQLSRSWWGGGGGGGLGAGYLGPPGSYSPGGGGGGGLGAGYLGLPGSYGPGGRRIKECSFEIGRLKP